MIFTTAYTSTMVRPLTDPELVDLLVSSRARNADRGVTGLLLYRGGRVLQMLEGDEGVVRGLYDRIRMDTRHDQITNVWTSFAGERRFPDWTMGFEDLDGTRWSLTNSEVLETSVGSGGAVAAVPPGMRIPAEQQDYLDRRDKALRRALASGERLVGSLAVILNGHDPETVLTGNGGDGAAEGGAYLRCRVCRASGDPVLDAYPCPTVKNAVWALEAAGPR